MTSEWGKVRVRMEVRVSPQNGKVRVRMKFRVKTKITMNLQSCYTCEVTAALDLSIHWL